MSKALHPFLDDDRLRRQIDFLVEIDRLKMVLRQTVLTDGSRPENTAEHSWHIALMVMVLAEWSNEPIDSVRVLEMLLVHDLVEIDAGDTFCYDEAANLDKAAREEQAADRIFGLLPSDQGAHLRSRWEEFEARETPEARFANAVDRLQPMMHNYLTSGHSWRRHGIGRDRVEERNRPIADGAEELWRFARRFLDDAQNQGWLRAGSRSTRESLAVEDVIPTAEADG